MKKPTMGPANPESAEKCFCDDAAANDTMIMTTMMLLIQFGLFFLLLIGCRGISGHGKKQSVNRPKLTYPTKLQAPT